MRIQKVREPGRRSFVRRLVQHHPVDRECQPFKGPVGLLGRGFAPQRLDECFLYVLQVLHRALHAWIQPLDQRVMYHPEVGWTTLIGWLLRV